MTSRHQRLIYVAISTPSCFANGSPVSRSCSASRRIQCSILGRRKRIDTLRFLIACACVMIRILLSPAPAKILLHGAYSPVLWLLLLLRRVHAVSILQGSELNVDFTGLRVRLITLILRRSALVVCRNEAQRKLAVELGQAQPGRCVIVNWGLKDELFTVPFPPRQAEPVLISPRATQREYNIQAIFAAVARLKKEGQRFRFIYVRFNPTFTLDDLSAADEVLEAPPQNLLWEKIAQADLCISVPDYDGYPIRFWKPWRLARCHSTVSFLPTRF